MFMIEILVLLSDMLRHWFKKGFCVRTSLNFWKYHLNASIYDLVRTRRYVLRFSFNV